MSAHEGKEEFIINGLAGQKKLGGTVKIHGAKNAALKAMAAAALFDGPVRFSNVPKTADVETLSEVLKRLGGRVEWKGDILEIDPRPISSTAIDPELAGAMRSSVVLTGPLLARFGNATFPAPGGCVIGARPIDLFLSGYQAMGALIALDQAACVYNITVPEGFKPAEIAFKKISVGATETLMMAAVLAKGKTILTNCALEPEIVNVAEWLNRCGAKILGVGTPRIEIEGTNGRLLTPAADYVTIPDRIETGSFLILGALCAENLTITDCQPDHLTALVELLRGSGVPITTTASTITVLQNTKPASSFQGFDVTTKEYPGLATDLQPIVATYLTQVSGQSLVTERIFEGRFKYTEDLKSLGAHIDTLDSQHIKITGPTPLRASSDAHELTAHDIRAGFAIVLAALVADGSFKVSNIHLIDRGYERLEEVLRSLGARIERT